MIPQWYPNPGILRHQACALSHGGEGHIPGLYRQAFQNLRESGKSSAYCGLLYHMSLRTVT